MKLKDLFTGEKTFIVYIDGVAIYQGNKYMELVRALGFVYMEDFINLILNCDLQLYIGEFVYHNNRHNIKVVER